MISDFHYKRFVYLFLILVSMLGTLSGILYYVDIPYIGNDVIRQYQFAKLNAASGVETIIVGDSSAGNAVNAMLLTELSSTKTLNLALSGSFGSAGSFNMIRHAVSRLPVQNVIIIPALSHWHDPFSRQGFLETLGSQSGRNVYEIFSFGDQIEMWLQLVINPRNIVEFGDYVSHVLGIARARTPYYIENDYFAQKEERYSNGLLDITTDKHISNTVNEEQIAIYTIIGQYCISLTLNCVLMHGSIHETIAKQSSVEIDAINEAVRAIEGITLIPNVFSYDASRIGDTVNHIDPAYKDDVTREYADILKEYLVK